MDPHPPIFPRPVELWVLVHCSGYPDLSGQPCCICCFLIRITARYICSISCAYIMFVCIFISYLSCYGGRYGEPMSIGRRRFRWLLPATVDSPSKGSNASFAARKLWAQVARRICRRHLPTVQPVKLKKIKLKSKTNWRCKRLKRSNASSYRHPSEWNEQIMRNEQVTIFDISEKQNDDDIGTAFDENNGNDDNDDRNA